jgi:ABC-type multidrug transport system fused ATPase/permease subunit
MENKEDKTQKYLEKGEKVADAMEKGVNWTDDKLKQVPSMMGSHRPKIMVGLAILLVIAVVRDQTMIFLALVIGAVLYAKQILSSMRQMAAKNAAKKAARTAAERAAELQATGNVEEKKP